MKLWDTPDVLLRITQSAQGVQAYSDEQALSRLNESSKAQLKAFILGVQKCLS